MTEHDIAHATRFVEWTGTPKAHQRRAVAKGLLNNEIALFHEPGCGKTYVTIHVAKTRFQLGQIDLLVVLCPKAIRQVWPGEFDQWAPNIKHDVRVYEAGTTLARRTKPGTLEVLVVAIEALSQGNSFARLMEYVTGRRAMTALDESSRIKNPSSNRTKNATKIAWSTWYRMILTGTPVTQGPHDLFAQMRFLNPDIIGIKKWSVFRSRYCIIGGFQNKQIVGYQNLEELTDRISPNVDIALLKDCVDIPDKIYQKITVPLTKEQKEAIASLKYEGVLDVEELGVFLAVEMALERTTRIQQIVGGSYPLWDEELEKYRTVPLKGNIPKLDALMEYIEDLPDGTKCSVWARFAPERERLEAALVEKYGRSAVVRFDGTIDEEGRKTAVNRIQTDPTCRFFVGNQTVAGIGLTLTAAKYSLFYSNTFSLEDRIQVENRNHRTGQTDHCVYVDFEAMVKEDRNILKAVYMKKSVAEIIESSLTSNTEV